jgi:hypothetical protein
MVNVFRVFMKQREATSGENIDNSDSLYYNILSACSFRLGRDTKSFGHFD